MSPRAQKDSLRGLAFCIIRYEEARLFSGDAAADPRCDTRALGYRHDLLHPIWAPPRR